MKTLPCFPCPHRSACCNWGTELTPEEAEVIRAEHGADTVIEVDGEIRTRTGERGCVFLAAEGSCSLHDKPWYPAVCRGFPWRDGIDGGPYLHDVTICPELAADPEAAAELSKAD